MRKRLYLQIYFALCVGLGLFALVASLFWMLGPRDREADQFLDGMASLVAEALPPADRPAGEQKAVLEKLAPKFESDLTLVDAGGAVVTSVGPVITTKEIPKGGSTILHAPGRGMFAVLALPDGRRLLADHSGHHHHRPFVPILVLLLFAGLLALAALPVTRRLVRRLENLRSSVDDLGRGDLRARVKVEGRDEVAELAVSFNRAAERIERLVHAQKEALATASHELRSPLARMRVALELLGPDTRPHVRDRISEDIAELDDLIGEILVTSRLDASPQVDRREDVDLLVLVAEEGARVGADVGGDSVAVRGDARLLRRLVRNLFENARRYGAGSDIEADVAATADGAVRVRVSDRGPGIPAEERERVFEAFYRRSGTSEGDGGNVGLGLALVRQIAESHGGSARVLPRDGGGTTIEVTLGR